MMYYFPKLERSFRLDPMTHSSIMMTTMTTDSGRKSKIQLPKKDVRQKMIFFEKTTTSSPSYGSRTTAVSRIIHSPPCTMGKIVLVLIVLWAETISSAAWFVPEHQARQHRLSSPRLPVVVFMSREEEGLRNKDKVGYADFTPRDEWNALSQEERNTVIQKRRLDDAGSGAGSTAITGTNTNSIYKGTVKWFDTKKGFGFITREQDGQEIFVHQTSLVADGFRSLKDGASVEFQIAVDADGKTKAIHVTGQEGVPLQRGFAYKKRDDS